MFATIALMGIMVLGATVNAPIIVRNVSKKQACVISVRTRGMENYAKNVVQEIVTDVIQMMANVRIVKMVIGVKVARMSVSRTPSVSEIVLQEHLQVYVRMLVSVLSVHRAMDYANSVLPASGVMAAIDLVQNTVLTTAILKVEIVKASRIKSMV